MNLSIITNALNHWLAATCPEIKGSFIGKYNKEATVVGAYKKYNIDIYFHTLYGNTKVVCLQEVTKVAVADKDKMEDRLLSALLETILINLDKIKDEITKV